MSTWTLSALGRSQNPQLEGFSGGRPPIPAPSSGTIHEI